MKFMELVIGFAVIVHVKCQLDVNIEDILYGEEDEEDDEEGTAAAARRSSTTARTRLTRTRATRTTTPIPAPVFPMSAAANLTNTNTTSVQNHTFILQPANGTIFGSVITSQTAMGFTTERVHYVLGQVGNIWNNVGKLNITGIVDQALGIRNSALTRPLVTGILNVVFCNPVTFSDNNCRKRGKDGNESNNEKNNATARDS